MRMSPNLLRPTGVLKLSTLGILASGMVSCDNENKHVVTEQNADMVESEIQIEKMDSQRDLLLSGEVPHNFYLEKLGYYHADAQDFFEHPYSMKKDGKFFQDGKWEDDLRIANNRSSRPTPECLTRIEKALGEETKDKDAVAGTGNTNQAAPYQSHGMGAGNMLMMYWLLSGNRNRFSPGAGFQRASEKEREWQNGVNGQRSALSNYRQNNPAYSRMVEERRSTGTRLQSGTTIRGGFGSSSRSFSS